MMTRPPTQLQSGPVVHPQIPLRYIAQVVFILLGISYIVVCPYNKVEESFNVQATHDLYYYGIQPAAHVQYVTQDDTTNSYFHPTKNILHFILPKNITNGTVVASNIPPPTMPYDHLQYPGVVPRTFFGPFVISWVCYIIRSIVVFVVDLLSSTFMLSNHSKRLLDISNHPYVIQFLSRLILFSFNISQFFNMVTAIDYLVDAVSTSSSYVSSSNSGNQDQRRHPPHSMIGTYMIIITACQFHLVYYYSRMLPNSFACVLALRSYYHWIHAVAISYKSANNNIIKNEDKIYHLLQMIGAMLDLTATTVLFRCDCILLLATIGLTWLITRQLTIWQGVVFGTVTVLVIVLFSMTTILPLDSLLWQRFVWAEGEVFYYNTVLNKSSNWGVSAWHWYFTSAIPRALLLPIFFIPLSFLRIPEFLVAWERRLHQYGSNSKLKLSIPFNGLVDATFLQFLIPAFGFVALYSCLGHKEVRFLYPVLPLFNLCAAIGLNRLHEIRFPIKEKIPVLIAKVLYLLAILALIVSFLASVLFVQLSRYNYPGGDALHMLTNRINEQFNPTIVSNAAHKVHLNVHIDVLSAMTGVNLFGQRAAMASNPNVVWSFDKGGYEENNSKDLNLTLYTHLLVESKDVFQQSDDFVVVGAAQGNPRLDFQQGAIATTEVIYVLERKDWISNNLE